MTSQIIDLEVSARGAVQAEVFDKFNCGHSEVTHILSSPMLRAVSTSCHAFYYSCLLANNEIIALPELQNMDTGPNGTGSSVERLQTQWKEGYSVGSRGTVNVNVDVWTFMCKDWNVKGSGKWSPDEVNWRVNFFKGFLKGIWLGGGRKKVEIAVVTHGSFLEKLKGERVLFKRASFEVLTNSLFSLVCFT